MPTNKTKPGQANSYTSRGHLLSYFTIFSCDYQITSANPSHLRTTTEGTSASTADCLPSPEESEDLLVRVALTSTPPELPANYPCGAPKCKTCPMLVSSDEFSSHTSGQLFKMKSRASCKSSNVIYFITCRSCSLQYVGKTSQPLHLRVNGHRFDITHKRTDESPVSNHLNNGSHTLADM